MTIKIENCGDAGCRNGVLIAAMRKIIDQLIAERVILVDIVGPPDVDLTDAQKVKRFNAMRAVMYVDLTQPADR